MENLITTDNITEQPASLVHIITGVTLFISHLFITIYNILTYQVVLFLVKKNVFKVIYKYRYILMTFDNGCYQSPAPIFLDPLLKSTEFVFPLLGSI